MKSITYRHIAFDYVAIHFRRIQSVLIDHRLVFLPMFHTFAAPLSHLAPLREGHTTYIMPRFSMPQFINAVERFGITEVLVVPPMIVTFVTSSSPKDFLKYIRFVWCGGAPLDGAIVKKMYRFLAPDACIAQVYGMTEAGWISTLKWPERDDSGSVGKLLPNVEAKCVFSVVIPLVIADSSLG